MKARYWLTRCRRPHTMIDLTCVKGTMLIHELRGAVATHPTWPRENSEHHHLSQANPFPRCKTTSYGRGQGLTRTLPVSVWADIITPAQSFTEVIQPTSAATTSSFSSTGLRVPCAWLEPLFFFWASWQQRESELSQ